MLRSMTGFGRCLVENAICAQQWEIRSVNGRYLDIKWKLPLAVRHMEPIFEKLVRRHASRGRVEISLSLQYAPGRAPKPRFDSRQANAMLECLEVLARERGDKIDVDYTRLLSVPALWSDPDSGEDESLASQLEKSLAIAVEDWNDSRASEGAALGMDLQSRILRMEEWTELIMERAPALKEEKTALLRERLSESLAANDLDLDDNRFLQEIVILADKLDVSEELTRLSAHLERLGELLRNGGDAGKRLDFTLQECFREINTCGNKLADAQLSRLVVDFKNELEKCREQVQNLE